jgi:hypothetical protein
MEEEQLREVASKLLRDHARDDEEDKKKKTCAQVVAEVAEAKKYCALMLISFGGAIATFVTLAYEITSEEQRENLWLLLSPTKKNLSSLI